MNKNNYPHVNPGDPTTAISATAYNARNAEIERIAATKFGAGFTGDDRHIARTQETGFWARLSAVGTTNANPYAFSQVYRSAPGVWSPDPNGVSGKATAGDYSAYEVNAVAGLAGKVVWLVPGAPDDYRFQWVTEGGGGGVTTVTIPGCFCTAIPSKLNMTSASDTCNFGMFQSCKINYGPTPDEYSTLGLGINSFLSVESFPDHIARDAMFRYFLSCSFNQFSLTRVYLTSPYGSPYRDGILYTWLVGAIGNTCTPFHLDNGQSFPGSDQTCGVTIDQ